MSNFGRIFLDRKIKEWRWYQEGNTSRLFIHLLLSVNYEDRHFENITVHRGEIVTSSSKLAEELRLSRQNIRTALNHLKSTGEITTKQHSKFTVITINNYNVYQDLTTLLTSNQPAANQQLTSNQPQCNKVKESKNTYLLTSGNQSENISTVGAIPTFEEVEAYIQKIGGGVDPQKFFNTYSKRDWKTRKGKPLDWKCAVRYWKNTEGKFKPKAKSKSESIPESPNAEAYRGLVYNIQE